MDPIYTTPLIIALIALLCSAFFSGMEIAFVSSNKVRAEIEMARGGIVNRILNIYYRNREMFISTLLIGNNIANIVYSMAMAELLTIPLLRWVNNDAVLLLVQTIIATVIILIFGEFVPKTIFRINPNASLPHLPVHRMAVGIADETLRHQDRLNTHAVAHRRRA